MCFGGLVGVKPSLFGMYWNVYLNQTNQNETYKDDYDLTIKKEGEGQFLID